MSSISAILPSGGGLPFELVNKGSAYTYESINSSMTITELKDIVRANTDTLFVWVEFTNSNGYRAMSKVLLNDYILRLAEGENRPVINDYNYPISMQSSGGSYHLVAAGRASRAYIYQVRYKTT